MNKYKDKLTFSRLEILCMVVMCAIVVVGGLTIVVLATNAQKVTNFKEDAEDLISVSKQAYLFYKKKNDSHIVVGNDNETKGMCITLEGLSSNDFLTKVYNDWDGYIVIEETSNDNYHYAIWLTNKEYVINGYDSSKIASLKYEDGITKYNNESFAYEVRTSFTGTTKEKGGTGLDNSTLKKYEMSCINEKIE